MHEHVNNARECNACSYDYITTKPNPKIFTKTQKPPIFLKKVENLGLNA